MPFGSKRYRVSRSHDGSDAANIATACYVELHPEWTMKAPAESSSSWGDFETDTRRRKQRDTEAPGKLPVAGPGATLSVTTGQNDIHSDDDDACSIASELSFTDMLDALDLEDMDSPTGQLQPSPCTDFTFWSSGTCQAPPAPCSSQTDSETESEEGASAACAPACSTTSGCREGARRRRRSFGFSATEHGLPIMLRCMQQ